MRTKLSPKFWFALTLFSLVGQIAWVVENMYLNVFIYKMFYASAAQIAMMVSASAVAAAVTTILMGALSDRVGEQFHTRMESEGWGRCTCIVASRHI